MTSRSSLASNRNRHIIILLLFGLISLLLLGSLWLIQQQNTSAQPTDLTQRISTRAPTFTASATAQPAAITMTATSTFLPTLQEPALIIEVFPTSTASPTAGPAVAPIQPPTATLTPTAIATSLPITVAVPTSWFTPLPSLSQWPAPLQPITAQTASKLGFNAAICADPDLMEFIRRVHPRVITAADDRECLVRVKEVSPSTITIGRSMQAGKEEQWRDFMDPVEAARKYVTTNLADYRRFPTVDYWEGWNEHNPQTEAHWHWYAQFEAARVCMMQAEGLHAAVGGFSVGWPNTYEQMQWFNPAIVAAHQCGGILTLHEYSSPTFACGVRMNYPEIIPGAPALNVPAGYYALRYRIWYEGLLKPQGLGDLPLAITELGIVGGPKGGPCNDPGYNGGSWKAYANWWVQQGFGPTGPQAYVNLLAWYDSQMQDDPYVIGASIFTAGWDNIWGDFDSHDLYIPLAVYEAHQR